MLVLPVAGADRCAWEAKRVAGCGAPPPSLPLLTSHTPSHLVLLLLLLLLTLLLFQVFLPRSARAVEEGTDQEQVGDLRPLVV